MNQMFWQIIRHLRACWPTLIVCDLVFKGIALLLLTPLVGLLFRWFLSFSGRTVLADMDIARFLLHPLGWLTYVLIGGAVLGIFALEQAVLITVCLKAEQQRTVQLTGIFAFVAARAPHLLRLTTRAVLRLSITALPFLCLAGGIYGLMLTDSDINFYLTRRPPVFWLAAVLIGAILLAMSFRLVRHLVSWVLAIQLLLYEGLSPSIALQESERRSGSHRWKILLALLVWFGSMVATGMIGTAVVVLLAQTLVAQATGGLIPLMIALGFVMLLTGLFRLLHSAFSNAACASLLSVLYAELAATDYLRLPDTNNLNDRRLPRRLGMIHLATFSVVCLLLSALIGATMIHSFELEDRVQITAHRGGAAVAPENTLAAIRRAIQDGADWVEVDVQETRDGVVVVVHDSDLLRVANAAIKVRDVSVEQLQQIDIGSRFDPEFRDERVPTLQEVLELCRDRVGVNIELKYYGHAQDLERRVAELVEATGMESQVVLMSLEANGIATMKALRPEWTVGLLTAVAAGDVTRAKADFLAVSSSLATRSFVKAAHRRGKPVAAWTVNDSVTMSAMISRGVDNLITDNPGLAKQVLLEREQLSPLERLMVELAFFLGVSSPQTSGS